MSMPFSLRPICHFVTLASIIGLANTLHPGTAFAQRTPATQAHTEPSSDTGTFAPLQLTPAPSATRLATGAPGPKYWQNRADYDLRITFDSAAGRLHGSMVLRYTNNSPDTLDYIWLQTERAWPAADTMSTIQRQDTLHRSGIWSQRSGTLETFSQRVGGTSVPLTVEGHQTVSKVTLAMPLKPGQTATFESTWFLEREFAPMLEVNQWYPRMVVYDDVKGWNPDPWVAEFFLEYGDYTVEITLPAQYIVASTGVLDNPTEVLPAPIAAKLAQAMTSDTVVRIITSEEFTNGTSRPTKTGMLTWKFHANNVRDVVWTAVNDYLWDGVSWHNIFNQAFHHNKSGDAAWKDGAEMVRRSVQEYSERWFPYPYPQAGAAEAMSGGSEYPMLTIVSGTEMGWAFSRLKNYLFSVISHEIGHQWFPMIVGSNERAHGWMDEGFTTFINSFNAMRWYPEEYMQMEEMPGIFNSLKETGPIEIPGGLEINTSYGAPSGALYFLREVILGHDVFDEAMRTYIQRWAFKHPTPADFFRTMEDVSKRKLDWFWRERFYTPTPKSYDLVIDSVRQTRTGDTTQITVTYRNAGSGVLPIITQFTYSDSTHETIIRPAETWQAGPVQTVTYTVYKKTVTKIQLDPRKLTPDTTLDNNIWVAPAQP